ncbi:MAG: hypothetical protein IT168_29380 [Bryobacterales bacterium]|nr:hypothetical protein [Bryobacterales bacterium]
MTTESVVSAMQAAEQALAYPTPENLMFAADVLGGATATVKANRDILLNRRFRRRLHNLNLLLEQAGRLRMIERNWFVEA